MKEENIDADDEYQSDQEDDIISVESGEKAVYVPGQGTKIVATNEEDLRNIDDVIQEEVKITKPRFNE